MQLNRDYVKANWDKLKNSEKITFLMKDMSENGPEKISKWYTVQDISKDDWEPGFMFETESGKIGYIIFKGLTKNAEKALKEKLDYAREKEIDTKYH